MGFHRPYNDCLLAIPLSNGRCPVRVQRHYLKIIAERRWCINLITDKPVVNIRSVRSNSHMICPLLRSGAGTLRLEVGIQTNLYRLRTGADDETTRRVVESDDQEDYLVASRRDHRGQRPHHAALARATGSGFQLPTN